MENISNHSLVYQKAISLVDKKNYADAIYLIKNYISSSEDNDDIALAYLNCGLLNDQLKYFRSAIDDFTISIYYEDKLDTLFIRSKDIAYSARSNSKYKFNDYEGAINDKRRANYIRSVEESNFLNKDHKLISYYHILSEESQFFEFDSRYRLLYKLSKIHEKKYDLIEDYKKVINDKKRNEIKNKLINLSESKYIIGDYKGSIRAIRRSEKYI